MQHLSGTSAAVQSISMVGRKFAQQTLMETSEGNMPGADCRGDAILISGDEIRLHVHADRQSTQGFRVWQDS